MCRAPSCGPIRNKNYVLKRIVIVYLNGGPSTQWLKLLTDGINKVVEGSICEERLRELPEEHLESSSGDVDVLPLTVIQLHRLI